MIRESTSKVYYAPTRGRRYFSKPAAIHGEAVAIIYKKYPSEKFESNTGSSYDIKYDEPERYGTMLRRMIRIVKAAS